MMNKKGFEPSKVFLYIFFGIFIVMVFLFIAWVISLSQTVKVPAEIHNAFALRKILDSDCVTYIDPYGRIHEGVIDIKRFNQEDAMSCFYGITDNVGYQATLISSGMEGSPVGGGEIKYIKSLGWDKLSKGSYKTLIYTNYFPVKIYNKGIIEDGTLKIETANEK